MPPVYMMSNSSECQWKLPILLLQNILNPNPVLGDVCAVVQFVVRVDIAWSVQDLPLKCTVEKFWFRL